LLLSLLQSLLPLSILLQSSCVCVLSSDIFLWPCYNDDDDDDIIVVVVIVLGFERSWCLFTAATIAKKEGKEIKIKKGERVGQDRMSKPQS
jgi:hypothetical protein